MRLLLGLVVGIVAFGAACYRGSLEDHDASLPDMSEAEICSFERMCKVVDPTHEAVWCTGSGCGVSCEPGNNSQWSPLSSFYPRFCNSVDNCYRFGTPCIPKGWRPDFCFSDPTRQACQYFPP